MSYPLIILGAGASFDYLSKDEEEQMKSKGFLKFPLTSQLCRAGYFDYLQKKIDKIHELNPMINSVIIKEIKEVFKGGESHIRKIISSLNTAENLEENVSDIWKTAKGDNNKDRLRQLIGFVYYLQFLFYFLSKEFGGKSGNNYDRLVNKISDFLGKYKDSQVLIVNFNYDLLLDNAINDLDEQLKGRLVYIKIHGSCDRCWICDPRVDKNGGLRMPFVNLLSRTELIHNFAEYQNEFFEKGPQNYDMVELCKMKENGKAITIRPALVLPFFLKNECGFPCSEGDLQLLNFHLPNIDRILTIGWSAKDNDFIELIKKYKSSEMPLFVVGGSNDDIDSVFSRLNKFGNFSRSANCVGFGNFLNSVTCKTFFGI